MAVELVNDGPVTIIIDSKTGDSFKTKNSFTEKNKPEVQKLK